MRTYHETLPRNLRLHPLVACLVLAFGADLGASTTKGAEAPRLWTAAPIDAALLKTSSENPTSTFIVKNCDDAGQDSLRDAVGSANMQGGAATIQFDANAMMGCSTISLSTGQIDIGINDLTIEGPQPNGIVIDGGYAAGHVNRVFDHTGMGTLHFSDVEITGAGIHASNSARGGCILSAGFVSATHSKFTNCVVSSDSGTAAGGAIYADVGVFLSNSVVSGNHVASPFLPTGGGIYTLGTFIASYTTLSGNSAEGGRGGALFAQGTSDIIASTIDHNVGRIGSALLFGGSAYLYNTTISNNSATQYAAVYAAGIQKLVIANSTISFNDAEGSGIGTAGVEFRGSYVSAPLKLISSIVSNNTKGQGTPDDLFVVVNEGLLTGSNNLVMASNTSPPGVISTTEDPNLGPLQFNGGWTQTHELSRGSSAIGGGTNIALPPFSNDQRGRGYPRSDGSTYLTDIGAVQLDRIFFGDFENR